MIALHYEAHIRFLMPYPHSNNLQRVICNSRNISSSWKLLMIMRHHININEVTELVAFTTASHLLKWCLCSQQRLSMATIVLKNGSGKKLWEEKLWWVWGFLYNDRRGITWKICCSHEWPLVFCNGILLISAVFVFKWQVLQAKLKWPDLLRPFFCTPLHNIFCSCYEEKYSMKW